MLRSMAVDNILELLEKFLQRNLVTMNMQNRMISSFFTHNQRNLFILTIQRVVGIIMDLEDLALTQEAANRFLQFKK
jgi:hypothetical protein